MSSSEPAHVFTYGTLQSERVLQAVLGRVPRQEPATLPNHRRVCLHARCYPAVIPAPHYAVHGKILLHLSAMELATLDAFEDPAYNRSVCTLSVGSSPDKRRPLRARAWIRDAPAAKPENAQGPPLADGDVDLGPADWSYERFAAHDEDWYVQRCARWAAWYQNL